MHRAASFRLRRVIARAILQDLRRKLVRTKGIVGTPKLHEFAARFAETASSRRSGAGVRLAAHTNPLGGGAAGDRGGAVSRRAVNYDDLHILPRLRRHRANGL